MVGVCQTATVSNVARNERTNGLNKRRRRPCLSCDFKRHSRRRALVTIRHLRSPPLLFHAAREKESGGKGRIKREGKREGLNWKYVFFNLARCLSPSARRKFRARRISSSDITRREREEAKENIARRNNDCDLCVSASVPACAYPSTVGEETMQLFNFTNRLYRRWLKVLLSELAFKTVDRGTDGYTCYPRWNCGYTFAAAGFVGRWRISLLILTA